MEGRIVENKANLYTIEEINEQKEYTATARGKLKKRGGYSCCRR